MNFLEKLLVFFSREMQTPSLYGWFHIMFLVLVVGSIALLVKFFKNKSEKAVSRFVLIVWIVIVILEVYKQLVFTYSYGENGIVGDYQWYAFPFQFCSTPLYVLPFIAFLKDCRLRDAAIAFMASFSLFAGIAVMLYPGDVFMPTIGINIQTMIHHGSQVVLGVFFGVNYFKRFSIKYFSRGIVMYSVGVILAMIMNIVVYKIFVANGIDETFNMFYISPYFSCTLPVLSAIYPAVPYPVFLVIYIIGFTIAAAAVTSIVYFSTLGIKRLYEKRISKV